eukprot:2418877-Rhodomonas_salina.4
MCVVAPARRRERAGRWPARGGSAGTRAAPTDPTSRSSLGARAAPSPPASPKTAPSNALVSLQPAVRPSEIPSARGGRLRHSVNTQNTA